MPDDAALWQLSPADRLELVAFDPELRRAPQALIAALWDGVDALESHRQRRGIDTNCTGP
jgi:hypothetical protein